MSLTGDAILTAGGVYVPVPEAPLRAWVKPKGEPPIRLYESPAEFIELWTAFKAGDADRLIVHEHEFGQPMAFFRDAEISYVGVSYATMPGRTTPNSIWLGACPCGSFGGRCPAPA